MSTPSVGSPRDLSTLFTYKPTPASVGIKNRLITPLESDCVSIRPKTNSDFKKSLKNRVSSLDKQNGITPLKDCFPNPEFSEIEAVKIRVGRTNSDTRQRVVSLDRKNGIKITPMPLSFSNPYILNSVDTDPISAAVEACVSPRMIALRKPNAASIEKLNVPNHPNHFGIYLNEIVFEKQKILPQILLLKIRQSNKKNLIKTLLAARAAVFAKGEKGFIKRFYRILCALWADRETMPTFYDYLKKAPYVEDLITLQRTRFFQNDPLTCIDYLLSEESRADSSLKSPFSIGLILSYLKKLIPRLSREIPSETDINTLEQLRDRLHSLQEFSKQAQKKYPLSSTYYCAPSAIM